MLVVSLPRSWYYVKNETSMPFLWLNTITFSNKDFVARLCPEAFLQALILRTEERLPLHESTEPLLEMSHALMQFSSESHDLPGGEYWRIWPGLFPFSLRKF